MLPEMLPEAEVQIVTCTVHLRVSGGAVRSRYLPEHLPGYLLRHITSGMIGSDIGRKFIIDNGACPPNIPLKSGR